MPPIGEALVKHFEKRIEINRNENKDEKPQNSGFQKQ